METCENGKKKIPERSRSVLGRFYCIIHHCPNPQEQWCRQQGARWCTSTSVHSPLVMNIFTIKKSFKLIPECGSCGKKCHHTRNIPS